LSSRQRLLISDSVCSVHLRYRNVTAVSFNDCTVAQYGVFVTVIYTHSLPSQLQLRSILIRLTSITFNRLERFFSAATDQRSGYNASHVRLVLLLFPFDVWPPAISYAGRAGHYILLLMFTSFFLVFLPPNLRSRSSIVI